MEIARLANLPLTTVTMRPGEHFGHEGDLAPRCAYVEHGNLFESKLTQSGARQIVGLRLQNEFVGLASLTLRQSDHDVQALGRVRLIEVRAPALLKVMEELPAIGRILNADALVASSVAQEWMLNVGRRSARSRVAHLLCELALRIEGNITDGNCYRLPLSQQQFGDAVGLQRDAVNKVLRELFAADMVRHANREITILDAARLQEEADFSARYVHLGQSERDRRSVNRPDASGR